MNKAKINLKCKRDTILPKRENKRKSKSQVSTSMDSSSGYLSIDVSYNLYAENLDSTQKDKNNSFQTHPQKEYTLLNSTPVVFSDLMKSNKKQATASGEKRAGTKFRMHEHEHVENESDDNMTLQNIDLTLIAADENTQGKDIKNTSIISQNKPKYDKIQSNRLITSDLKKTQSCQVQKDIQMPVMSQDKENRDIQHENTNLNETTEENFTKIIFDPDETADNNDPKWSALKELQTNEDYFRTVKQQWKSVLAVNPHKDLTIRFMSLPLKKKENMPKLDTSRAITCHEYIDKKIISTVNEIRRLEKQLPRSRNARKIKKKIEINNRIVELEHSVKELKKNREELKNINMFYHAPRDGWDANYLTKTELDELKQQDKVLELYENFYK